MRKAHWGNNIIWEEYFLIPRGLYLSFNKELTNKIYLIWEMSLIFLKCRPIRNPS